MGLVEDFLPHLQTMEESNKEIIVAGKGGRSIITKVKWSYQAGLLNQSRSQMDVIKFVNSPVSIILLY